MKKESRWPPKTVYHHHHNELETGISHSGTSKQERIIYGQELQDNEVLQTCFGFTSTHKQAIRTPQHMELRVKHKAISIRYFQYNSMSIFKTQPHGVSSMRFFFLFNLFITNIVPDLILHFAL